jgi:hypothetical protein
MNNEADVKRLVASARANVLATIEREPSIQLGRRRRTAIAIVGGVSAAAVLSGAAFAVAQASREDVAYTVNCYGGPSLSSPLTTVAASEGVENQTGDTVEREELDPIEACAAMWRMGILGQDAPTSDANNANFPVPPLKKCTLNDGIAGVFAPEISQTSNSDFCLSLGLQP